MVFRCIDIHQVPWEGLKTAASGLGFQHLPRDLANVNAWKNMFDPYSNISTSRTRSTLCRNVIFVEAVPCKNVPSGHADSNANIKLRGCAVWSGLSLSNATIIGKYRLYQRRAKTRMRSCACPGWCESTKFCACSKTLFCLMWTIGSWACVKVQ